MKYTGQRHHSFSYETHFDWGIVASCTCGWREEFHLTTMGGFNAWKRHAPSWERGKYSEWEKAGTATTL